MAQNYKIFIRDVPLMLSGDVGTHNTGNYLHADWNIIDELDNIHPKAAHLRGMDGYVWPTSEPDILLEELKARLRVVKAAGGIVWNRNRELLLIFRRGRWDLPKGKVEEDESIETAALREVEEESGVGRLRLLQHFDNSYHLYTEEGEWTLKETHWFEMISSDIGEPKPQTSEGITDVRWTPRKDLKKRLRDTYPNVRELVNAALERGYPSYTDTE